MSGIFELDAAVKWEPATNLLIVDCLNLCFRYKHRGQADFSAELLSTINSFAKSYNASKVVVLADYKGSAYRKDLSDTYKAGRKDKFKDQTEEEKQKSDEFFKAFEAALVFVSDSYPLVRLEGVEADDVAAFLVKRYGEDYSKVWMISTDRDWDLLLSDSVSRFSYVTRKEYTIDNFWDEHGCDDPEQYISMKILQGDAGDSVDGVSGIGVKKAYSLVREHGTAMDIYCNLPLPGKQKFIQALNASGDLIIKNYQLMDLLTYCEEAINFPDPTNLDKVIGIYNGN